MAWWSKLLGDIQKHAAPAKSEAGAVSRLLAALGGELKTAEAAARELARLGPDDAIADRVWNAFTRRRIRLKAAAEALQQLRPHPAGDGERALHLVAAGEFREAAQFGEAALIPLEDALDWSGAEDRAAAAAALGEVGAPATVHLLEAFFTQEAQFAAVRGAATAALDRIDPTWRTSEMVLRRVPAVLHDLVATDSEFRRRTAARILGELGNREAAPALRAMLDDPDDSVRREVVRALAALGDSVAEPATGLERAVPGKVISLIVFRPGPPPAVTDEYGSLIARELFRDEPVTVKVGGRVGFKAATPPPPNAAGSLDPRLASRGDVPDLGWEPAETYAAKEPGSDTPLRVLVFGR